MEAGAIKNRYPLFSLKFIGAYIVTMRPYLMFVSGITGIAGFSFGPTSFSINYLLLFSAAFLSYGFGQALTDCFQIDTDSLSSPYRPLTKGVVSKKLFLIISCTGLSYCVLIFSFFNPLNLILGIISGIGLATYTTFKRRWWGGPFYNSWIVGILFLISFLSVSDETFLSSKLIFSLCAVFFGYANFVLSGYFKDIFADRSTGYNTLPVVFGRKISSIVSDAFAFLTILFSSTAVLLILINSNNRSSFISIIFLFTGSIILFTAQTRLHRVRTDDEAHHSISFVVHSYILILTSIAVANQPEWSIFLLFYYIFYLFILKIRPSKNQI
jgi:geranylgeranylglycerol-phosphate geranylgeranyltransferase